MDKNTHFDIPTQVLFVDEDGVWRGGIAYRDEIICGCCGGVYEISEVIEFAPDYVQQPIHKYESWIDISDEICGDEMPDSFIIEPTAEEEEISVEC